MGWKHGGRRREVMWGGSMVDVDGRCCRVEAWWTLPGGVVWWKHGGRRREVLWGGSMVDVDGRCCGVEAWWT